MTVHLQGPKMAQAAMGRGSAGADGQGMVRGVNCAVHCKPPVQSQTVMQQPGAGSTHQLLGRPTLAVVKRTVERAQEPAE